MVFRVGLFLPFVISALLASRVAAAGEDCEIIYVAKGHTNPVNDGSSWANAFCDDTALADGIAAAAARMDGLDPPPCVDVYVAAGVYKPSDSGASFSMHDKVHLYGGFKVGDEFSMRQTGCVGGENAGRPCETGGDCPGGACDLERVTLISGDINDDDDAPCTVDSDCGGTNLCIGGQCAIAPNFGPLATYNEAGTCTLDGFVLTSAYASMGSAVRIVGQPNVCPPIGPTLRDCLIRKNYTAAGVPGGGAVSNDYAGTTIDGCIFSENEAYDDGGALRSRADHLQVRNSIFKNNAATGPQPSGGAVYLQNAFTSGCPGYALTTFEDCKFAGNVADRNRIGNGGAVAAIEEVLFSRCSFYGNSANRAGAIEFGDAAVAVVDECLFIENVARDLGAGAIGHGLRLAPLRIRNSTFARNVGGFAGAIESDGYSIIEGCSFLDNSGGFAGAINSVADDIKNTLFAGNTWLPGNSFLAATAILVNGGLGLDCEGCRFIGNGSTYPTVTIAVTEARFVNSVFAGNHASALSLASTESFAELVNCTIVNDATLLGSGAITTRFANDEPVTITVENSVLWGSANRQSATVCAAQIDCGQKCACLSCMPDSQCFECDPIVTVDVGHSDIEHPSCVWPGAGNINEDPMFVRDDTPRDCDGNGWGDPQCAAGPCLPGVTGCDDYGDFRLRPGSPAINAGDPNTAGLPATDLDGNPRVAGCPDMGAYEFEGGGDCCMDEDCAQDEICCANICTPYADSDGDTVADCFDHCPGEDDRIDADQNGTPDCAQFFAIPAVSTWGLVVLALLLLIASKTRSPAARRA